MNADKLLRPQPIANIDLSPILAALLICSAFAFIGVDSQLNLPARFNTQAPIQSGVALRFPPHSTMLPSEASFLLCICVHLR